MPNDDLGQFPTPNQPIAPIEPTTTPIQTPPMDTIPTPPTASTFEETPEEIPSVVYHAPVVEPSPPPVESMTDSIQSPYIPKETYTKPVSQPLPPINPAPPIQQPIPATLPASSAPNMGPIIFAVIFIVAVVALAGAAFLFQQTQTLKNQLTDITKTLQKQQTSPETTPTPSVFEVPELSPTVTATPSVTPTSTVSGIPTLTPTPTTQVFVPGSSMKPLSVASKVMQIAVKHQPNAQLILIKTENANDPLKATTKYFFRQDLTTKKYFYVLISAGNNPEVVDKQIYVTPDDNIPSLNDMVLQNNLGIDLDQAITISVSACADPTICTNGQVKAQYIKTSAGVIWQISTTVTNKTDPLVIQIDATTKAIIFKSTNFAK